MGPRGRAACWEHAGRSHLRAHFAPSSPLGRPGTRQTDRQAGCSERRERRGHPGDWGHRGRTQPVADPASDGPLPVEPCGWGNGWGARWGARWGCRAGRPEAGGPGRVRVRASRRRAGPVAEALCVFAAVSMSVSMSLSSCAAGPGGQPVRTAVGGFPDVWESAVACAHACACAWSGKTVAPVVAGAHASPGGLQAPRSPAARRRGRRVRSARGRALLPSPGDPSARSWGAQKLLNASAPFEILVLFCCGNIS